MNTPVDVMTANGYTTRLTVSPDRITLKIPRDTSDAITEKLSAFATHVAEQFVDIDRVWRGAVKTELAGVFHMTVSLKADGVLNARRYEAVL